MELNDIIKLLDAGYTKEEIDALSNGIKQPENKPEQPVMPENKPEQPVMPENKPEQTEQPVPHAQPDKIKNLETKLDYVVNRLNYLAVQSSRQPEDKKETIDDILKQTIR